MPASFFGGLRVAATMVASISVPFFSISPLRIELPVDLREAALQHAAFAAARRKRQIVVSSGVAASSAKPQKRRNDSRSSSASSSPGSERS